MRFAVVIIEDRTGEDAGAGTVVGDDALGLVERLHALAEALVPAAPEGYQERPVGAFAQGGQPVLADPRRDLTAVARLVDPLTSREQEVLELLAAGKPNQKIAEELVVTLDTVKRHVSHILGKLQVANRTQAATRAAELQLLRTGAGLQRQPVLVGPTTPPWRAGR